MHFIEEMPDISVIIPVYNEEKSIQNLLSCLTKTNSGFVVEIVVVDGGSTDSTVSKALKFGVNVIYAKSKGRASQMNEGAEAAKSSILFFLHADSIPPQNFDRIIARAISANSIAGCFQLQFDDPHPLLKLYALGSKLETTLVRFGDQGLFVMKDYFKKIGGFDEALTVMEDQKIVRELKKIGRFTLLEDKVITSARKYKSVGIIKLQVIFVCIWTGYYLGLPQEALVHFYNYELKRSDF